MHCNDVPTQFLDAPRRYTEKVGYLKMHCNDVPTQFFDAPPRGKEGPGHIKNY